MYSKRGVANITLMIGIVMAIAVLLIGGVSVIFKLVEGEARASPKFIATDLVLLIGTLQSAPENAVFEFYTPQDDQGYPLIGSLEVDDSARKLCIAKKTEHEMINTIAESAGISAFGTGGQYAYQQTRSKFYTWSQRNTFNNKIPQLKKEFGAGYPSTNEVKILMASDNKAGTAFKTLATREFDITSAEGLRLAEARMALLSPNNPLNTESKWLYLRATTKDGRAYIKYLSQNVFLDNPASFAAEVKKIPGTEKYIYNTESLRYQLKVAKETNYIAPLTSKTEIGNPIPKIGNNLAVSGEDLGRVSVAIQQNAEEKAVVVGATKPGFWQWWTKLKRKVPFSGSKFYANKGAEFKAATGMETGRYQKQSAFGGKIGGILFVGSVITMGYLTGDWQGAIGYSLVPAITMYVRHWVTGYTQRALFALGTRGAAEANAIRGDNTEDAVVEATPPPADTIAGIGVRSINTALNIVDSVYNMILMDWWIVGIFNSASAAVNNEKKLIDCEDFTSPKEVLLTPPNCDVGLEDGPAVKDLGLAFKALEVQIGILAASTTGLSVVCSFPNKVCSNYRIPLYASVVVPQVALIMTNIGINADKYAKLATSPSDIIPRTVCKPTPVLNTCDATYLRQDCPNWYISDPGAGTLAVGGSFMAALNTGWLCAGLSWLGWQGPACTTTRYVAMTALFVEFPGQLANFILQGYKIGLSKRSISAKAAPELGLTDAEFADNNGYWYAEMPFVIEFTKIYTDNSTSQDARTGHLVIRKI